MYLTVQITEEKVMIKGHDSHHSSLSRLGSFAKLTYQSDRNKGKDNIYNSFVLVLSSLAKMFVEAISFEINGISD